MYHTVNIEGYRGFDHFEMRNLGCVNLLVGKNNSGKTSVLEALHLLSYGGDLTALWQLSNRRGERFSDDRDSPRYTGDIELDISHLFKGHELQLGCKFTITARNQTPESAVTFEIGEPSSKERIEAPTPPPVESGALPLSRMVLRVHASPPAPSRVVAISRRGGINFENLELPRRTPNNARRVREFVPSSHFISSESLSGNELAQLWDTIQLKPAEQLVLEALRFIDPEIQQIRSMGASRYFGDRSGFIVKRADYREPFPLGSLGDGAWRMLAMAIVVTQCRDGVLLIDEIDTGLHYTVMADMWKLIFNAAREFNVQVFATTHSFDCVHSLATLCSLVGHEEDGITIQRIEANRNAAVAFTGPQIRMIAERDIEVR
jgi:energy-coupling factor transporter ATP-binding protein EcfA2